MLKKEAATVAEAALNFYCHLHIYIFIYIFYNLLCSSAVYYGNRLFQQTQRSRSLPLLICYHLQMRRKLKAVEQNCTVYAYYETLILRSQFPYQHATDHYLNTAGKVGCWNQQTTLMHYSYSGEADVANVPQKSEKMT